MLRQFGTYTMILALGAVVTVSELRGQALQPAPRTFSVRDASLTHKIREELMLSPLSHEAKNVTIVARRGTVSLRGKVANTHEKRAIERTAEKYAMAVISDLAPRAQGEL